MKKVISAVVILILLILISALNILRVNAVTDMVCGCFTRSEEAALRERFDIALEEFDRGMELWQSEQGYINVIFRHPELDQCYDAMYEVRQALLEESCAGLPALYSKLIYHMEGMAYMEMPSFGSIF